MRNLILIFVVVVSGIQFSQAQVVAAPAAAAETAPEEIRIQWYKPAFLARDAQGKVRTILSGRTVAGTDISVGADEISVIQADGEIKTVKSADIKVVAEAIKSDGNGYFELLLDLPEGGIQLPIQAAKQTLSKTYQINLSVTDKSIVLKSQVGLEDSPSLSVHPILWVGVGSNYVRTNQESSATSVNLTFESFRLPALLIEGFYPLSTEWGVIGAYKKSPGAVKSPAGVTVGDTDYSWDILSIEGRYTESDWKTLYEEKPAKYYFRFGINEHSVPFWNRNTLTSADISTNKVLMASVGAQIDYDYSEKWIATGLFRYQLPLSSGSLFSVRPKISFDGSVGAFYRINSEFNLGGFWYGQYHSWSYSHFDRPLGRDVSGTQSLLFSNLELRAGYSF